MLAELLGAFAVDVSHFTQRFQRRLHGFIEPETIDIQAADLKAGMAGQDITDGLMPFTHAILDRGELRELALPVGEISKRLQFAILVEITIVAAFQVLDATAGQGKTCLIPEFWVAAALVVLVSILEVGVS